MSWTEKLKARWALKSTYQVIMVLIVFALTGTSVLFLKEPIFSRSAQEGRAGCSPGILNPHDFHHLR